MESLGRGYWAVRCLSARWLPEKSVFVRTYRMMVHIKGGPIALSYNKTVWSNFYRTHADAEEFVSAAFQWRTDLDSL